MCSITERLLSCAFTAAPGDLFWFLNFNFHGCHAGIEALVGAVAKRLGLALAARTPPVFFSSFHFDGIR